jgi:hypothetical protein
MPDPPTTFDYGNELHNEIKPKPDIRCLVLAATLMQVAVARRSVASEGNLKKRPLSGNATAVASGA